MKKTLILIIAAAFLLQSCLFENEKIFDNSPTERLNETITQAQKMLESYDGYWSLEYFPELEYGGYNYIISFKNGVATIGMELETSEYADSCLYRVKAEDGAVITFDTYSRMMHFFRNPSTSRPGGYGGDYEFIIENITSSSIEVRGKLTGNKMAFVQLPDGATQKSYLDAVHKMSDDLMDGDYIIYSGKDSIGIASGSYDGRYLTITSESDGDTLTTNATIVYTPEGFRSYEPITVKGISGQQFKMGENGMLTSAEGSLSFKPILIPKLYYEDYIGDWIFTFNDGTNTQNVDVTITELVDRMTYTMTGLSKDGYEFPLVGTYDRGKIKFYTQPSAMYGDIYTYLTVYTTSSSSTWTSGGYYGGDWNKDPDNIVVIFTNNNSIANKTVKGMNLYKFTSEVPSSATSIGSLLKMMSASLTKK